MVVALCEHDDHRAQGGVRQDFMNSRALRAVLVCLNGFTAVSAIGGGIALITGLERDRFPVDLLRGTPFRDFFGPGLLLGGLVGGSAAAATAGMLWRPRLGVRLSTFAGIVLVGWVCGEVAILRAGRARSWLEPGYFVTGLLMAGLGLLGERAAQKG
jgi:hypothetical protein